MIHYITGPLVGAVIGYITNDIAIRMLFRPHHAKHLLGLKLPFTPGIIPKEKPRIAASIGKAVSENLINPEVLEKNLLGDDMLTKIDGAISEFVAQQQGNDETLEHFISHYLTRDDIAAMRGNVTDGITSAVTNKLENSDIGGNIAHIATLHVMEKTRNSLAGRLGGEALFQPLAHPIEKLLAKHINEIMRNNSRQMVAELVKNGSDDLLNLTMRQLTTEHDEQLAQIKKSILNVYRVVITQHLPRILNDINISGIIERRINDMDMNEAEAIILDVMKKELRAIVWLGALLGCIMGTVTTLI